MKKQKEEETELTFSFSIDENGFIYCNNLPYMPDYFDLHCLEDACKKTLKLYRKKGVDYNSIKKFNDHNLKKLANEINKK